MTKLCFISDTHGRHEQVKVPKCDLLIHCGDFSNMGYLHECESFLSWFSGCPAREKIFIAGNHDKSYQEEPWIKEQTLNQWPEIHYLENSGINLFGLNIWGSPYSLAFYDWAFQIRRDNEYATAFWSQIPKDTNILITHGQPYGVHDTSVYEGPNKHLGDSWLLARIEEVKPEIYCGGHFHQNWGKQKIDNITYINATSCDENLKAVNKPIVMEI